VNGPTNIIPYVIESGHRGERSYDIYSRLLKDRIVLLGTEVDDFIANAIVAQFLFLASEDKDKPIQFYINSPGGSITAGLAIYDCMQLVKPKVHTTAIGQACSMGAFLLAAGAKGERRSLPNARIMTHKLSGWAGGHIDDGRVMFKELERLDAVMNRLFAKHTGKTVEQVEKDTARDLWLDAEEAKAYGIVDEIQG
jgi:ATP-dependent Clp protease, protease subunit